MSLNTTALTLALGLTAAAQAATFTGNGATGFGGPVGNGSLTVTDGGTNVNFSFTPSGAFTGNVLVLYLDTVAGGVNNTSTLTAAGDDGKVATSGLSGSGRTLATFAPGFTADYAIAVQPQYSYASFYGLSDPANFTGNTSANYASSNGVITFSVTKASLGLPASGGSFSFEGTLISGSGYRSNETIGTSVTAVDPTNVGTAPNAGFTGTQTFSTANAVALPEPASLAVLGLGAVGLLRRRK